MMWFFAVLIVLAMGGVALLASGRGRPMSEEYGDRPDSLVPATGPVRAEDLRRIRFSLAVRGYRMSEVDGLLDRLARQLEEAAAAQTAPATGGPAADAPDKPGPADKPGLADKPGPPDKPGRSDESGRSGDRGGHADTSGPDGSGTAT